jgi:hypothetical protein
MDRAAPVDIAELAAALGITRLCHFTPLRNLVHLASDDAGLLSLRQLAELHGDYDQQDLERLDRHTDHICCSIEYPNAWYLRQRKLRATPVQRLFPDWVCLTIEPKYLWKDGSRVCVRNAAADGGTLIQDISPTALEALYASEIKGARGQTFVRTSARIAACPTDDQAEVLVHKAIPLADVQSVLVSAKSDAKRFHAGLRQIGANVDALRWAIAPALFDPYALSSAISQGARPVETSWEPE